MKCEYHKKYPVKHLPNSVDTSVNSLVFNISENLNPINQFNHILTQIVSKLLQELFCHV